VQVVQLLLPLTAW